MVIAVMMCAGFIPALAGVGAVTASVAGGSLHNDLHAVYLSPALGASRVPGSCGVLHCYTPQEIQQAYNYGPSYAAVGGYANAGAGQTIVIFDAFGDPNVTGDLAIFDAVFGLPSATLNVICPAGCPTLDLTGDSDLSFDEIGWTQEITLDTQYAHAMAPAATIDLVVAHSDSNADFVVAEQYALTHHLGNIWSQSFGSPECTFTPGSSNPWFAQNNLIYLKAAAQGITMFASAGDLGATSGCAASSSSYPADNPLNIAVAGTTLTLGFAPNATVASPLQSAPATYSSETTWNDFENANLVSNGELFGVTGGAPSQDFFAPIWQILHKTVPYTCTGTTPATCSAGTPYHSLGRVSADVAYDAGVDGGVLGYYSASPALGAGFYIFGGTSAGSPQWAAIAAIADQISHRALGDVAPLLYALSGTAALHDIVVGSNAFEPGVGYDSGPGWDAATGVGSPNVGVMLGYL
ncbi:MAG: hypothetical protein ACLQD8_04980 [Thermoplasmata archaeon]